MRERRQLLHDLRRKYGETLADVLAFLDEAACPPRRARDVRDPRGGTRRRASARRSTESTARGARSSAPPDAPRRRSWRQAVERELAELAMAKAKVAVEVGGDDPGDDVAFLLAANPGAPLLPLSKVASGGELARAMLALRLVLLERRDDSGPPTLVFDEVDAGIGGRPRSPSGVRSRRSRASRQVLVVTHLPQVAAHADTQVAVTKSSADGRRRPPRRRSLDDDDRVIELSRMLSGSPDSATAREHAAELLRGRAAGVESGVRAHPGERRTSRDMLISRDETHLRDGWGGFFAGEGHHGVVARSPAEGAGACGSRCRSSTRTSTSTPAP